MAAAQALLVITIAALLAGAAAPARADDLPKVASINLCADQLVLALADPAQILTVSWLAADPQESMLAAAAAAYPLNYGSAEELLRYRPDVVIAGAYTAAFTRALLQRLGHEVIVIATETTLADVAANLRLVGGAVGQSARAEQLAAAMSARVQAARAHRAPAAPAAVVVRPGGFTVGADSFAHELMTLAGVRNVAAELGLDRWGSLSLETLLRSSPDLIVFSGYHANAASLANMTLQHPALARLRGKVRTVTVPAPLAACGLPASLRAVDILQDAVARR
jgi:iron complex transport system substrate-binding protein